MMLRIAFPSWLDYATFGIASFYRVFSHKGLGSIIKLTFSTHILVMSVCRGGVSFVISFKIARLATPYFLDIVDPPEHLLFLDPLWTQRCLVRPPKHTLP